MLTTFNIDRSLSKKGCPYDNAVAEATYKIIKTEFAFNRIFDSFEDLEAELFDYVNWYNNFRIHSSLNYLTPIEYKKSVLIKIVKKVLTIHNIMLNELDKESVILYSINFFLDGI